MASRFDSSLSRRTTIHGVVIPKFLAPVARDSVRKARIAARKLRRFGGCKVHTTLGLPEDGEEGLAGHVFQINFAVVGYSVEGILTRLADEMRERAEAIARM